MQNESIIAGPRPKLFIVNPFLFSSSTFKNSIASNGCLFVISRFFCVFICINEITTARVAINNAAMSIEFLLNLFLIESIQVLVAAAMGWLSYFFDFKYLG